MKDALGDRMKSQYEDRTRYLLPRRTYTVIRVDGRAFHTLLRGAEKPYDPHVQAKMVCVALQLFRQVSGAFAAYQQSDEVSVLAQDFAEHATESWFGGNVQKMASVAASVAATAFQGTDGRFENVSFDARAFTIPDRVEVGNYLVWRQKDAIRNFILASGQARFGHKAIDGMSTTEIEGRFLDEGEPLSTTATARLGALACRVPLDAAEGEERVVQVDTAPFFGWGLAGSELEMLIPKMPEAE